ncbi:MAG: tRNA/rRNA methyltransferase SpoU [Parcubacteria group bacterium Gr01-1014_3]|nr:MAG: tRNA/rRNA methyltransferase SpoU [Parcubacteria group bacterium Gr01-1014_3]
MSFVTRTRGSPAAKIVNPALSKERTGSFIATINKMIAILHNIRSLHNVGSIFRTADAAGIEKVYLGGITPEPVDIFGRPRPQLTKVALGGEKSVPWDASARSAQGTSRLIDRLKKEGYKIFAIEQSKKSIPYHKLKIDNLKLKIALVVGNEVRGLSPAILKKADKILEIPMHGKKESLNVAVAFGIVVFRLIHK